MYRYMQFSICQLTDELFPLRGYYKEYYYEYLCARFFVVRCFHLSCIYSQKGNCWVITVTLYLTSCDATRLLFKEATLFCTLTSNLCRLQFSHPCQHLLLSTYFIHFCEREVVTVLLICISLMANEIEDLFTG